MNKDEITNLLEMLYDATLRKKIVWSLISINSRRAYKVVINGCDIMVSTDFSPLNDCQVGRIDLYNSVGQTFLAGQFFERISEYVESEISVTAMAVESAGEQMILASVDVAVLSEPILRLAREKFAKLTTEVAPNKLIACATHTHTSVKMALKKTKLNRLISQLFNHFKNSPNSLSGTETSYIYLSYM